MESGLLLAHREGLYARDLLRLRSNARLAVLAACETNVQGLALPDEVVSLPSALIESGVAGVVGTFWSVLELSTAILIVRFYVAWRAEGHQPAEALALAQGWLRTSTKRQLTDYFRDALGEYGREGATREGIPPRAASALYRSQALMEGDEDDVPFRQPYFWAGFCYVGA